MSTTTYVARIPGTDAFYTRTSPTMSYTHAVLVGSGADAGPLSWHLTEAAARQAASSTRYSNAKVVAVEAHEGGKGKVERMLLAARPETEREKLSREATERVIEGDRVAAEKTQAETDQFVAAMTEKAAPAKAAPAKKAPAKKAPAKKAAPAKEAAPAKKTAGTRAIPTGASNSARQAWIDANGMDSYRKQYNGGWDSSTAGTGEKKASSGTASVAWMDGYTDRKANPGKAGIAAKWAALRSGEAPAEKA
jgi:hypothetical protein